MQIAALVVAAGRGLRAGGGLPKQWRPLGGQTIAARSMAAFAGHPRVGPVVLVVARDSDPALWPEGDRQVVFGGESRAASVLAGLEALEGTGATHVLIHDAARPLVSAPVIDRVIEALAHGPAAAPALPVVDALWQVNDGQVIAPRDRSGLARAQTPQGFDLAAILAAHRAHDGTAADDVEVALAAGLPVTMTQGDETNFKITRPEDFARADAALKQERAMDIRTGSGFDVHRFGPGDHVVLCGIKVPHGRGLQGHSDADVGMHALTDAIYGALAEGDIGRHFPPSDPQWKGAESYIFLGHACDLARSKGYAISNADVTLICERPKITPHAPDMIAEMARYCGIAEDRMSVKATTSERLGFTGREEGIAAMATVTLVKP